MQKILFLGDSITDANRNWNPHTKGLGEGYVHIISNVLNNRRLPCQIINKGHDGFTVPSLLRTLEQDCLLQEPDFVSILVGINDVGISMNTQVTLEMQDFSNNYEQLIHRIRQHTHAPIICMAPFIFPHPQEYFYWIPEILKAQAYIQKTAAANDLTFLPLHERLNEDADRYGYREITTDGIHLTEKGHEILAQAWLDCFDQFIKVKCT